MFLAKHSIEHLTQFFGEKRKHLNKENGKIQNVFKF